MRFRNRDAWSKEIALAPAPRVVTLGIGQALFGTNELTVDLSLGAGWVINLTVAEYVIRRQMTVPRTQGSAAPNRHLTTELRESPENGAHDEDNQCRER